MRGSRGIAARAACGLAFLLTACGPLPGNTPDRITPISATLPAESVAVDDDDRLAWATDEPFVVVVRKHCRTLDIYRFGVRVRSFPAVFGLGVRRAKVYQGDHRTPTGFYAIIDKRPR